MKRRLCMVAMGVLCIATLVGWQKLSAKAASDHPKAKNKPDAHAQEKLALQPTGDAQRLNTQVETAMHKAAGGGYYACCIRPACSWCLLHVGKCTCMLGVGTGRWACRECHGGWEAGQGYIPGKTREDVRKMKTLTVDDRHEMLSAESTPAETATPTNPAKPADAAPQAMTATGAKLYAKLNCQSCHKIEGTGGSVGPDLTHEAQRHADISWQIQHLQYPDKVHPGSTMPSFANLKPEELKALAAYLVARK